MAEPLNPFHPAKGRTPFGEAELILEAQTGMRAHTLLGGGDHWTLNAASLTLTFLSALETAAEKFGSDRVSDIRARLDFPKGAHVPHIPSARVADSSKRAPVANDLVDLAMPLLSSDPMAATRLFIEAHCLFAREEMSRNLDMKTYGPPWARALVTFARHHSAAGHHALALDLAGLAREIIRDLAGFAAADAELQSLLGECATLGAELLIASGDRERGEWMLNARRTDLAKMQREWQTA